MFICKTHRLRWKVKMCVSKCKSIQILYFAMKYKNVLNRNDRSDLIQEKIQL